jgi:hypothetical protein
MESIKEKALERRPYYYESIVNNPRLSRAEGRKNMKGDMAPISEYLLTGETVFQIAYDVPPLILGIELISEREILLLNGVATYTSESDRNGRLIKRNASSNVDDEGLTSNRTQKAAVIGIDEILERGEPQSNA